MRTWSQLRISTRLYMVFGLMVAVVVALLGVSYWQQARSEAMLREVTVVDSARLQQVSDLIAMAMVNSTRVTAIYRTQDPAVAELFGPLVGTTVEETMRLRAEIRSWATSPVEVAWFEENDRLAQVSIASVKKLDAARTTGDKALIQNLFDTEFIPGVKLYTESLDALMVLERKQMRERAEALRADGWQQWWMTAAVLVVLVSVAVAAVVLLVRYVVRSLDRAVKTAETVAVGDLTVQLNEPGRDEFAVLMRALSGMSGALRDVVLRVRSGTEEIADASLQIAQGNQDLSDRTERQASNLQQTASTMEQLSATVRQSAESASEASQLASRASTVAQRGGTAVGQVVLTMGQIEQSSRRIAEIIGVIDGISFQTNILALNAAVEAARAGEQGRGFAVVAGEVRNLAQRSATAAKEIKTLIADSHEKVRAGSTQVEAAGQTMAELVQSVQQVSSLITAISGAAAEQHAGIDGVTRSVSQLDQTTQQNAALVEEAAAAAASMRYQANALAQAVSVFKVTVPA